MSAQITISGSSAELRIEASHGPRIALFQKSRRNGPRSGGWGPGTGRASGSMPKALWRKRVSIEGLAHHGA